MRTVALIVPAVDGRARPARRRRRRSRGAPRGGSRASAGRSTGPLPRSSRLRRVVEEVEPEVEEARRDRLAVHQDVPLGEVPAARADDQRRRLVVQAVVLALRSRELDRALDRVDQVRLALDDSSSQVGEFASSKSAMKQRAPELSALIIILRSTGPVISTRRSCRSAGTGATRQSASRISPRLREGSRAARRPSIRACRSARAESSSLAPGVEAAVQARDELERVLGEDLLRAPLERRRGARPRAHDRQRSSRGRGRVRTPPGTCTRDTRRCSGTRAPRAGASGARLGAPRSSVAPSGLHLRFGLHRDHGKPARLSDANRFCGSLAIVSSMDAPGPGRRPSSRSPASGSVSRAADALFVTQPALTARLQRLEGDLGASLFVRTSRGMRLTEAGEAFLPYAVRALETLSADGRMQVNAFERGGAGQPRASARRPRSQHVRPSRSLLKRFRGSPPARIGERANRPLRGGPRARPARAGGPRSRPRAAPPATSSASPLYEDRLVLVVDPAHPFAERRTHPARARSRDEQLILFDRTSSYHELTSALFRDGGRPPAGVDGAGQHRRGQEDGRAGVRRRAPPADRGRQELEVGQLAEVAITDADPAAPPARRDPPARPRRRRRAPSPPSSPPSPACRAELTERPRPRAEAPRRAEAPGRPPRAPGPRSRAGQREAQGPQVAADRLAAPGGSSFARGGVQLVRRRARAARGSAPASRATRCAAAAGGSTIDAAMRASLHAGRARRAAPARSASGAPTRPASSSSESAPSASTASRRRRVRSRWTSPRGRPSSSR